MTREAQLIVSASSPILDGAGESPAGLREIAQLAERYGLDFLVLDGPADTLTAAAWLIGATQHLGLIATLSTSYAQPFHAARALASMDTLSRGRMGWVASTLGFADAAPAYGPAPTREQATARALEYVAAAQALWDSWDADALVIDKPSAVYLDSVKIRRVDFRGEYFGVMGPLNAARPPQGYPVLVADDADPSFEALCRHADVLLVGGLTVEAAKTRIRTLRAQGAKRILFKVGCSLQPTRASDGAIPPSGLEVSGDGATLLRQLLNWRDLLGCDGMHLLANGSLPDLLRELLPQLNAALRKGVWGESVSSLKGGEMLRARLDLPFPINPYSTP